MKRKPAARKASKVAPVRRRGTSREYQEVTAQMRSTTGQPQQLKAFTLPLHPPSVMKEVPNKGMAMDTAITDLYAWAGINQILTEGLSFLGYPYLSELAQRPEYRRMSEVIATNMTRKWIKLQASGDGEDDKTDKIKKIEDEMKRLKTKETFQEAAELDGFFGRSHIYVDTGDTDNAQELMKPIGDGRNDISQGKVSKAKPLLRLKSVEAVWCYPSNYNSNDPLSPSWYKPEMWVVMGRQIHISRLLTFVGREVPDLLKPAYSFGGLSLSQMAKPYIDNWIRTRQSVADLIHSFSVCGIKTNLGESVANGGADLFTRIDMFNATRDNRGLMVLNNGVPGDAEEFFNVSTPLSTLDALQAQTQEHMCSVAGIPVIVLLGIQPAGLNASSEGEIRIFYDWIHSFQEKFFRPNLTRVIDFIQLSLFGAVDPDITFIFEPLWAMDEVQKATVYKTLMEADTIAVDKGVLDPIEVRKRIAADPDSPHAGLDVDDLPEVAEPEPEEGDKDDDAEEPKLEPVAKAA